MIVDAATYVTDRMAESAAERAAERIGPKVAWAMAVVMLGIAASVFCLAAGYTYLATIYGSMGAALAIATGCALLALVLLIAPWVYRTVLRPSPPQPAETESAFSKIDEEPKDVIDYFGAAKVVATAFMFGFGAARKFKQ